MEYTLTQEMVKEYERHLRLEERSNGTIQKYLHNIEQFRRYLPREKTVTKETVIAYKKSIAEKYAISTANAALVALNGLFSFLGWRDCRSKGRGRWQEFHGQADGENEENLAGKTPEAERPEPQG